MKRIHEQVATSEEALAFRTEGMAQLEHLLIGVEEAKLGALVMIASGANGVYTGIPGTGKSTLAKNMHRLVEGIEDRDIAIIPPMADLTAKAVVGGQSEVTKTIEDEQGTYTEKTSTDLEPIIHVHSKVIRADEINRGAPHATNATLDAREEGKVTNTAGEVELEDILFAVATMNPAEARQGVFPITDAMASRHYVGVALNNKDPEVARKILGGWDPSPSTITPVADIDMIQKIRNRINKKMIIPDDVRDPAVEKLIVANRVMQEEKILNEGTDRMAKQLRVVSKTLGALAGQDQVSAENIDQALKFIVTARVGMLGRGNTDEVVDKALTLG